MKTLVKINSKNNLDKYLNKCDGFILGISNFSVDFNETFTTDEIKTIVESYSNKDVFISINKSIFNDELDLLLETLIKLDKLNIKGILFYDLSVLYLKNKYNLSFDLVWNQTHMVTNYNTCNYYNNKGVKYGFISGEITKEEILEINKRSNMDFLLTIVGYQTMSFSRRKLLTNYYTSINKTYDGTTKEIYEHNDKYYIREDNNGTVIKTGNIFNGIEILPDLISNDFSYVVIDESYIDSDIVVNVLDLINKIISGISIDENIKESYKLIGNNTSFLYKKAVFKVKKEDK